MNEKIKEIALHAGFAYEPTKDQLWISGPTEVMISPGLEKFAELIIKECTQLLFTESERLFSYAAECENMRHSDEADTAAEKCMDNILMIEQHFGVE